MILGDTQRILLQSATGGFTAFFILESVLWPEKDTLYNIISSDYITYTLRKLLNYARLGNKLIPILSHIKFK